MDAQHQIRRHGDGNVDFDFYRREAFLLRRAARTEFFNQLAFRLGGFARPLVVLAIVSLAIAVVPGSARSPATAVLSGASAR
jgi:hypothetical protein